MEGWLSLAVFVVPVGVFQLVGVVSTLTCEECILENKDQRRCRGVNQPTISLGPCSCRQKKCQVGGKKKTTELAEHQDPAQVQQSKLQTLINGTEIGD